MKKYKFRAWNKRWKAMEDWDILKNKITGRDFNEDNLIIMQWTGMKDEKGKEIYEGDVVEGGYLNPLTGKFISQLFEISYNKGNYIARRIGSSPYGDTWLSFIEGEVVGNIYENPELMKEEE